MNSVLEMVEENSTDSDWEVVHLYCGRCYPEPDTESFAFCGADIADERVMRDYGPEDQCVMCVDVVLNLPIHEASGERLCPRGHKQQ